MDFSSSFGKKEAVKKEYKDGVIIHFRRIGFREYLKIQSDCFVWLNNKKILDEHLLSTALCYASVCGWDGVIVDGKPKPCTPENVTKLLDDPDNSELALFVFAEGGKLLMKNLDKEPEEVKNS